MSGLLEIKEKQDILALEKLELRRVCICAWETAD